MPASQVSLSRRIGAPEYLVFSSLFERETAPHPTGSTDSSPTPSELERVASSFVDIRDKAANGLPNIVIMHAESTFDPNRAFRLAERVDLPVWSAITETKALGPLKVNVVGGGSWVTDFEVITGADSRLFGLQGYYTSYYVAPLINYSFVRYLSEKGYTAKAFSAIDGSFYNSEKAFGHYGFEQFVDGAELGMSSDWDKALDSDLAGAVIRYGAFAVGKVAEPFLYFIDSIENHGPHPCRNFESEEAFVTTFVHNGDFELNCELNEYLARAMSTSDAFSRILDELRSIEAATGRPYVLLVFGDHQPWDFTGGRYSVPGGDAVEQGFRDFATVRSNANVYETFFHLVSSEDGVIADLSGVTPPASFLPSLVSAFVASSYDELYFPENFFLLRVCGSDFATPDCDPYPGIAAGFITTLLAEAAER